MKKDSDSKHKGIIGLVICALLAILFAVARKGDRRIIVDGVEKGTSLNS